MRWSFSSLREAWRRPSLRAARRQRSAAEAPRRKNVLGAISIAILLAFAAPAYASDRALPDALASTVSQHGDQLQRCYRRGLQQTPDLGGKLVVRFKVAASGRVKQVAIVSGESTLHDAGVEMCVTRVFRAMRFRTVSDAAWFRSPLIFAA